VTHAEIEPARKARAAGPKVRGETALRAELTIIVVILVGAGSWLQLERQSGVAATNSIWAEDGHLFLTSALIYDHPLELLVAPAGGYMHAVPRILAMMAARLRLELVAAFLAIASSLTVASLAAYVFFASRDLIPSPVARMVLAGGMVLAPAAAHEATNNTANLHYYFLFAAFWALLSVRRSWAAVAVGSIVVLAAAVSDPLSVVLLPVALWRALRSSSRGWWVVPAALVVGLVVQGLVFLSTDRIGRYADDPEVLFPLQQELEIRAYAPRVYAESHPEELPTLYGLRVAGSFLIGDRLLPTAWESLNDVLALGALAVVLALFLYGLSRRDTPKMPLMLTLASSVAFFAAPVAIRGTEHIAPVGDSLTYAGSRYVIVPVLLLLCMSLMILNRRDQRVGWGAWRAIQVTLLFLLSMVVVSNYKASNLRTAGPQWDAELATGRAACETQAVEFALLPVAPRGAGFNVLAPCDRVLAGGG
jgi:hypothetical protein